MERIYENGRFRFRMGLVMAVAAGVLACGGWLLAVRYPAQPGTDPSNPVFVALIMGITALMVAVRFANTGFKTVMWLDVDERSGRARLGLWRPVGEKIVETSLPDIVEWCYETAREKTRMPVRRFRARIAEPDRWLIFELAPAMSLHPVFSDVAPQAVADYERDIGMAG